MDVTILIISLRPIFTITLVWKTKKLVTFFLTPFPAASFHWLKTMEKYVVCLISLFILWKKTQELVPQVLETGRKPVLFFLMYVWKYFRIANYKKNLSKRKSEFIRTWRATLKRSFYVSFSPPSAHPSAHKKTFPEEKKVQKKTDFL